MSKDDEKRNQDGPEFTLEEILAEYSVKEEREPEGRIPIPMDPEPPRRKVVPFLIAAAALNLAVGGWQMAEGGLVEHGILTYRAANLLLGGTCLVILLVFLATPASSQEDEA